MSLVRIFAIPGLLALLTAAGLLSALLGDGAFDVASWICLAAPLGAGVLGALTWKGRPRR